MGYENGKQAKTQIFMPYLDVMTMLSFFQTHPSTLTINEMAST